MQTVQLQRRPHEQLNCMGTSKIVLFAWVPLKLRESTRQPKGPLQDGKTPGPNQLHDSKSHQLFNLCKESKCHTVILLSKFTFGRFVCSQQLRH